MMEYHPHPREGSTPQKEAPPGEMAAAADGTHPTGMHSCFMLQTEFDLTLSDFFVCFNEFPVE